MNKGILVKKVRSVYSTEVKVPRRVTPTGGQVFSGLELSHAAAIWQVRNYYSPPITGKGHNIAILDSGIRTSHEGLRNKVVYSKNFSNSPTLDDVYDHGTSCAWVAAGGVAEAGKDQGVAPGVGLLNVKVLGDDGVGTDEAVVLAIDDMIELKRAGEIVPCVINLSLGTPDDGDPNSPMRIACRAAKDMAIAVVAACGNEGPNPGTLTSPATDPTVWAVGAVTPSTFTIAPFSSRGPTKEELIKPDIIFFGDDMRVADARSDVSYSVKAGTSFSAAFCSGLAVTGMEMFDRLGEMGFTLPAIPREYEVEPCWFCDWFSEHVSEICVKPEGVPPEKDNTWGWGMPLGTAVIDAFRSEVAGVVDVSGLVGAASGLVGVVMVMGFVGMIARAIKW